MVDSNKEIPIRIKAITNSNDITGDASFLSIPSGDSIDFIGNFGETFINKKSCLNVPFC